MPETGARYPFTRDVVQCPYPHFARMRAEDPVPRVGDLPFHVVTRYDDVVDVATNPENFLSGRDSDHPGFAAIDYFPTDPEIAERMGQEPTVPVLGHTDKPDHTRQRKLVSQWFTPRAVRTQWQGTIDALTEELISGFEADGVVDLMKQFALPLPVKVIARILGFDDSSLADLKRWSDAFLRAPAGSSSRERWLRLADDHIDAQRFYRRQIDDRLANPGRPDLLASLVSQTREGGSTEEEPLSIDEVKAIVNQLLVAGNETTTQLIGQTMLAITKTPGLQDRLRNDLALVSQAVEEGLRYTSPITGLYRSTVEDTEVGGCPVAGGSVLFLAFGSANHDEAVFAEPETFDIDRPGLNKHVAFGTGMHICLGLNLARAEANAAIAALVRRLPGLRTDSDLEVDYGVMLGNRALETLPMRFDPVTSTT